MSPSTVGRLVLVGVDHQTAPVEIRERLAISYDRWKSDSGFVGQIILLSTCNRLEVYTWALDSSAAVANSLRRSISRATGMRLAELAPYLRTYIGAHAVRHLVRVASGLCSLVVGEEQIRGQVREAYRAAQQHGPLSGPMDGVFNRTLQASRALAAGTSFGRRPSIASSAVSVASRLPELTAQGLSGQMAVILGAGSMAAAAAQTLAAHGCSVVLLNRNPDHARQVAGRLGATAMAGSLEELPKFIQSACIVVGATASRTPVLSVEAVTSASASRGGRTLVVLDIALPRDVEPGVRSLPGVHLLDLDDLERLCPVDISERNASVQHAEHLALIEAEKIERWLKVRAVSPAIAELRRHGERIRAEELRRSAPRLQGLTPEQHQAVEALANGIVKKLLHGPTLSLREQAVVARKANRSRAGAPTLL